MAFPVAPIAVLALRYGSVALAAYAVSRQLAPARRDQRAEDALDDVPEGLATRHSDGQVDGTARWHRTVRFGRTGPGFDIDATSIARIRIKKV